MRRAIPVLLLAALFATVTSAHRPSAVDGELTVVEDPEISWAFYAAFETGDETFLWEMNLEQDFATLFEVLVPVRFEALRPSYALVGPGLPPPPEDVELPRELPEGAGAVVVTDPGGERRVFFEAVLRDPLFTTGALAVPLRAGTTEIWVWSPDGERGEFLLGIGVEEDFSGAF